MSSMISGCTRLPTLGSITVHLKYGPICLHPPGTRLGHINSMSSRHPATPRHHAPGNSFAPL
ncbi:hypothetical protein GQ53DRAFT_145663 [Thozetella sp. PMI_491]|nr:hypothetical protein GQ53DRAFT_145663 [Thozetella sp. PMI_491]